MDPIPPPAISRRINREVVCLFGFGRAILLQLAHPLIAAGVAEHSEFRSGLRGYAARTRGTVGAMLTFTFGTDDAIHATAARIRAIHDRVHGTLPEAAGPFAAGTSYSAHDPALLRWVHATLLESVPYAYEVFVGPLTDNEKDRYCAEAVVMESLLGAPAGTFPRSLRALEDLLADTRASGVLAVTPAALRLAHDLLSAPVAIAAPLFPLVRLLTLGLLPPALRAAYGFPWDDARERRFRRAVRLVRSLRRTLPPVCREWPASRQRGRGR